VGENKINWLGVSCGSQLGANWWRRQIRIHSWAHGLATQIDGSAILTRTGDGHTSIYTSDCAKSAMDAFLVERRSDANPICEG
jgi:TAP-like protein